MLVKLWYVQKHTLTLSDELLQFLFMLLNKFFISQSYLLDFVRCFLRVCLPNLSIFLQKISELFSLHQRDAFIIIVYIMLEIAKPFLR